MAGEYKPPRVATPTSAQVAHAFIHAAMVEQVSCGPELVATLLAHSALETGHWKHLRCFNFGNVKANSRYPGDYTFYEASEILSERHKDHALKFKAERTDGIRGPNMTVKPQGVGTYHCYFWGSHPEARFRAYPDLASGAREYLKKLTGRYHVALDFARVGQPKNYVNALQVKGYFTANLERYRSAVVNLYGIYFPVASTVWVDALEQHEHASGKRRI